MHSVKHLRIHSRTWKVDLNYKTYAFVFDFNFSHSTCFNCTNQSILITTCEILFFIKMAKEGGLEFIVYFPRF